MKKPFLVSVVLGLMLFFSSSCAPGVTQPVVSQYEYDRLLSEYESLLSRYDALEAELNAPQALVQIREMDFEWTDGDGKIVGEVKNYGEVDAINVYVRVKSYKGQMVSFGDFVWVDYLRAGENKPFELKVSKPYCDDEHIPQIELGYKTVGEYGREWKSQIMGR